ncbi:BlaI/MecI/CopY family transcriptional regulator [Anaerocolumna sp. AGMB13020]|uniref:BlaI/MecI/CopY family transcriptional regulator n=1 Tax=Anaerocolumna sp. AGMB13020 TaxID=3081750 RepID=UPI00295313A1|nr:BlaI/MecI/CopY family transcriptional regulator [Anaerocolumna sp. AGMB13020]WOO34746.1 BlaI/MecI/CopY family transcriptional regulator [Anaerocolumna sp. AGMB13020]
MAYIMTESEYKFAEIIWSREPLASGELVRLCQEAWSWKKSTTYTVLKKLCVKGILKNEGAIVTAIVSREEYLQLKSEEFLGDNYDGSLPKFLTAFISRKKLSGKQMEELREIIDSYKEDK